MDLNWVALVVSGLFGAGMAAIITALYTGKQSARRIGVEADGIAAKTPAEVDSIAIQGAETTVLMMQGVNQALLRQNERQATRIEQLETLVARLDIQLESYRQRVEDAETALRDANQQYADLRQELDNLRPS